MSTGIVVSGGSCDEKGDCTFTGSWKDPISKGPVEARLASRWTGPTVQIFEMFGPGPDSGEIQLTELT